MEEFSNLEQAKSTIAGIKNIKLRHLFESYSIRSYLKSLSKPFTQNKYCVFNSVHQRMMQINTLYLQVKV